MAGGSRPFTIAHISDLHVSTFGDTFHDRARITKRSKLPLDTSAAGWLQLWEERGWKALRYRSDQDKEKEILALVDPDGYSHPVPPAKTAPGAAPLERAIARARFLDARWADSLAATPPSPSLLTELEAATPNNSNLRFLRAVRGLDPADIDAVIVTGDITDNGDGWSLVEAALAPWQKRGRVFAVPGNHDLYLFPLTGSGRPRPTKERKRAAWNRFASWLNLELDATGAWFHALTAADAVIIGLDSCALPQRRFYRHNGAIGEAQLDYLRRVGATPEWRRAKHRLVALHHHVVPLPHGVGRRAPFEIGMRLDDAKQTAKLFDEIGVNLVLHGHRHVSEHRQPAGSDFEILSSPSFTLGCRSGDRPSYWRIELDKRRHVSRVHVAMSAMGHDDHDESPTSTPEPDCAPD